MCPETSGPWRKYFLFSWLLNTLYAEKYIFTKMDSIVESEKLIGQKEGFRFIQIAKIMSLSHPVRDVASFLTTSMSFTGAVEQEKNFDPN